MQNSFKTHLVRDIHIAWSSIRDLRALEPEPEPELIIFNPPSHHFLSMVKSFGGFQRHLWRPLVRTRDVIMSWIWYSRYRSRESNERGFSKNDLSPWSEGSPRIVRNSCNCSFWRWGFFHFSFLISIGASPIHVKTLVSINCLNLVD